MKMEIEMSFDQEYYQADIVWPSSREVFASVRCFYEDIALKRAQFLIREAFRCPTSDIVISHKEVR